MGIEMLKPQDIFDFYGCQFLASYPGVDAADVAVAEERINEVHAKYLYAARERIKAECRFLGIEEYELSSLKKLIGALEDMLSDEISQQADTMRAMGTGFNMGAMVTKANMAAGRDVGNLANAFGLGQPEEETPKNTIDAESLVKDPKWHTIAEAFVQLEDATTPNEKAMAIDRLNGLQHNSFHLLIDLQTGRMLEGEATDTTDHSKAVNIVKEVLDIKMESKTPMEFAGKMSSDVRKMLVAYRYLMPKRS
jgi:hypothetical protein